MTDGLDRKEFVAGYLVEAEEHLRAANVHLLAIESSLASDEPEPRRVRELFRAMHTLKGLSGMVGVDPVVDLAHEMEAILRVADQHAGRLSATSVELLLAGVRAIEVRTRAFAAGQPVPAAPAELLEQLSAAPPVTRRRDAQAISLGIPPALLAKLSPAELQQLAQGLGRGQRVARVEFVPSPARAQQGATITTVRERLSEVAEIVKVLPISIPRSERAPGALAFVLFVVSAGSVADLAVAAQVELSDVQELEAEPPSSASAGDPAAGREALPGPVDLGPIDLGEEAPLRSNSIRVDVARLDDAMESLSELVVTSFRLRRAVVQLREQGADVRELNTILGEHGRQLRALRGCVTRARMVPLRELLERVPLIVRGMSRSTGKQVRLVIEAGSAELDKAVGERVFPAIVHLVRNAIDHAIEPAEERRALGKPEEGLVEVSCFQHANRELELRVSDDGRGMDARQIAAKLGRAVPRDDAELLELITLPGFSTLEQATSNSGRGMGMEIVQRIAVNTLGGTLALQTAPQHGTTFTLRIPLTISIVDSFAFACGEEAFVVPVAAVDEIIELDPSQISAPPAPRRASAGGAQIRVFERRGRAVPLLSLSQLFGSPRPAGSSPPGVALPAAKALVVRRTDQLFAVAVDRMLGQQEVVVRPLEDPLVAVTGVTGTTDLGDGKPTLVLDLPALVAGSLRGAERRAHD